MTTTLAVTCQGPESSGTIWNALAKSLGIKDVAVVVDDDVVKVTAVTTHVWTGRQTVVQSKDDYVSAISTLCGCVAVPSDYWVDADAVWLRNASAAMLWTPALLPGNMATFMAELEATLSEQAFLGGSVPSTSDVVIALWLIPTELGPRATTWFNTVKAIPILSEYFTSTPGATVTSQLETLSIQDNVILDKLGEWNIPHSVYSHPLCHTAEELVTTVPIPSNDTHTKNLLFKDKKHGMFLLVMATSSPLDTKSLGKALGLAGKTNMRLADEETLASTLGGVKPGCVGVLCILHDTSNSITLVLDQALFTNVEHIHSHPMRNDMSVCMTPTELKKFIEKTGHAYTMVDFCAGATGTMDTNGEQQQATKPSGFSDKQPKQPKQAIIKKVDPNKKVVKKGETLLALQWKKADNFPMWYSDVIVLSEMISYYDISGCYILRPWSYKIWELITEWFNGEIKPLGVENSYFPMFVSKDRLEKEKDHVEGFSPEVAWVTKSGDSDLAAPIAVRPTSETIMYPAFSDWIKSHRDLPLKLNQWSNVVRWEFKDPTPFLRTREFLWQEGHTAHATLADADVMVMQALELYRRVYEELLAVPVIKGYKTEKEKFAGGYQTTTVEAYVPTSGRAIQGATSHNLGQNFAKMFDIRFQDHEGKTQVPWQTSWGLTTRTIGVMVMVHGDDTGLVLPPMLSPLQVVIVPILSKNLSMEQANPTCEAVLKNFLAVGIRAKYDDREMYNPGWKYNHWEQKGVPLRVEVGPRDIEQQSVRVVVRFNGEKIDLPIAGLAGTLQTKLVDIQAAMFAKAKEMRDAHLVKVTEWKDFVPNLELNNLVLTPWCGGEFKEEEEEVKEKSKEESLKLSGIEGEEATEALSVSAKTLCIPFDQPELPEGTMCFHTGKPAKCWVLWGRSY